MPFSWGSKSKPSEEQDQAPGWERRLVEELAREALREQRKARRWGVFFKLFTAAYLVVLLALWSVDGLHDAKLPADKYTAVVKLEGLIADDKKANADNLISGLRDAFEDDKAKGVILRINSPGGSPVQAGMINDEIRRLRKKYPEKPIYAVVTDLCASGGYYVAVAADKIYVDKGSIVGSIGVLMNGFGFQEAMEDLGVERRLLTSGEHKGLFDPFSPLKEFDRNHLQGMLDNLHKQFINSVREGRGDRLKENDQIFSGLFWSGEQSIELGLADGLGSAGYVAREVIGAEEMKDFTHSEDLLDRIAQKVGAGASTALAEMAGFGVGPQVR